LYHQNNVLTPIPKTEAKPKPYRHTVNAS